MSIDGGQYPDNTCCPLGLLVLRATKKVAQDETATCDECLFPFCVMVEARNIDSLSRAYLASGMMKLGYAVQTIASRLNVNERSVYRYEIPISKCHWCNVDKSPTNVFCRTSAITLAFDEDKVVAVLSSHRHASKRESSLAANLVGNLFPYAVLHAGNGDVHEHWSVTNVSREEAQEVYENMNFLSQFTNKLGR